MTINTPNDLYHWLQTQMERDDVKDFKNRVRKNPIPPADLERCETFMAVCQKLEEMKVIKPDDIDFEVLKDHLFKMGKQQLVDVITGYQESRLQAYKQQAAATGPAQGQIKQEPQDPSKRDPPANMYN